MQTQMSDCRARAGKHTLDSATINKTQNLSAFFLEVLSHVTSKGILDGKEKSMREMDLFLTAHYLLSHSLGVPSHWPTLRARRLENGASLCPGRETPISRALSQHKPQSSCPTMFALFWCSSCFRIHSFLVSMSNSSLSASFKFGHSPAPWLGPLIPHCTRSLLRSSVIAMIPASHRALW